MSRLRLADKRLLLLLSALDVGRGFLNDYSKVLAAVLFDMGNSYVLSRRDFGCLGSDSPLLLSDWFDLFEFSLPLL